MTELKMMMQQAKEKLEELDARNKELEQQNQEMQDKIAKRDAMITQLGGGTPLNTKILFPAGP